MAAKKQTGATVSADVDETKGLVTVYVEHGGLKLPVASVSLDYATARAAGPAADEGSSSDDNGEEG